MSSKAIFLIHFFLLFSYLTYAAASIKQPEFAGQFYPEKKEELLVMIDSLLEKADPKPVSGDIFMLFSPHAGYGYSGSTAAFGYKLVKEKPCKTVIILGPSHHKPFNGAAFYPAGAFATSLGMADIDEEFIKDLSGKDAQVFSDQSVFDREHSLEVQLPFVQRVLKEAKIVPLVVGDCTLEGCERIALALRDVIGKRKDILVIVSTDLYHGYDFQEAANTDEFTLDLIRRMDYKGLYYALREQKAGACGGTAAVIGLALAKGAGYGEVEILNHTNSALVTGELVKGNWTVGYAACAIFNPEGEAMLNIQQKEKLLKIARQSIQSYLKTGKKLEAEETDLALNQKMGAFVTFNKAGQLRGCIGNLVGSQPLYLTVRDMAVEAGTDDPRFGALKISELKDVEIEISVLSVLERVDSADKIILGKHGVLVKRGFNSGVFLPQVAAETGWSKEEFLNYLCLQKAGLSKDCWKDKDTELYIFTAEVFSEKELEK